MANMTVIFYLHLFGTVEEVDASREGGAKCII